MSLGKKYCYKIENKRSSEKKYLKISLYQFCIYFIGQGLTAEAGQDLVAEGQGLDLGAEVGVEVGVKVQEVEAAVQAEVKLEVQVKNAKKLLSPGQSHQKKMEIKTDKGISSLVIFYCQRLKDSTYLLLSI